MSDTPIQFPGDEGNKNNVIVLHAPCRVAYTINNKQPVACTIISDTPIFYLDIEEDFDDEIFDPAELEILEREVSALKKEIDELERFSGMFENDDIKKFQIFAETIGEITDFQDVDDSKLDLQILISKLEQSRLAKAYLDCALEYNVEIKLISQCEDVFYDRKSGIIQINNNLNLETAIMLAVRELRRHWQHRQGGLIHPIQFHPDSAVAINRIQVADLCASMVRVAWELQLSGYNEVWENLENTSMADLAHAFAREAFTDFRTINNGEACTAVFEAWFLSDRCRAYDKTLIQQMLADYQGNMFDIDKVLNGLGVDIIAAIGSMPFGKNYLSKHAGTILEDPIFTDIRDRSNANFLWFIKFERSFRETEQQLQIGESSQCWNEHDSLNQQESWSTQNGTSGTAEIVQFNAQAISSRNSKSDYSECTNEKSAEIVYLRQSPAE